MDGKEALNKIQHHINGTELSGKELLECYKTIDKALERLEELENDRLLDRAEKEELERVNAVLNHNLEEKVEIICELEKENQELKEEINELSKDKTCFEKRCEKLKKAIEILKDKKVVVGFLLVFPKLENYNRHTLEEYQLTQQEFDLLKEVFEE